MPPICAVYAGQGHDHYSYFFLPWFLIRPGAVSGCWSLTCGSAVMTCHGWPPSITLPRPRHGPAAGYFRFFCALRF